MPNITLTRVDNRLIHGQVGVTWAKSTGANLLLLANDAVANNPIQKKLMETITKSSGVDVRFFSIEHTAKVIFKAADRQKIFMVCETPKDVRRLIELGVPITEVNIGNMHFSQGKIALTSKVYVDDADREDIEAIKASGANVFIQDVPDSAKQII